jgi:hypothetical protein
MKNTILHLSFLVITLSSFAQNTSFGNAAGDGDSGSHNSAFGYFAGPKITRGSYNNFIGSYAGFNATSAYDNNMIGYKSGYKTTTGDYNNFIGHYSAYSNTTGSYNAFSGSLTGRYNTTGSGNSFIGYRSGYKNKTGDNNVYLGNFSGYNTLGSRNVFLGSRAGYNEEGSDRLYIDNTETSIPLIYGKFDTDQVGINTNEIPTDYTLAINGKTITEEVFVRLKDAWPDYVFAKAYPLPTLEEVETFINKNGHLPNIPSAEKVTQDGGVLIGDMNTRLLNKIEELTLYIIQQNKEVDALKKAQQKTASLEVRLAKLEAVVLGE